MKVLIVDDSASMRKIVARVLRQAELALDDVLEAGNGREALDRLAAHADIELVLLDLYMPEMDGLECLQAARLSRAQGDLRIVMVSSEGAPEVVETAARLGADAWVTKPFSSEQIRAAVEAPAVNGSGGLEATRVMNAFVRSSGHGESRAHDDAVARALLGHVCGALARTCEHTIELAAVSLERSANKCVGPGVIHISFKLDLEFEGRQHQGALLLPLPDAVTLACLLLVVPPSVIEARRIEVELDASTKDALLEVGNLIGGALGTALRKHWGGRVRVRSAGCQGVKPGVAPAFARSGDLLVIRGQARIASFAPFEMLLMLPEPPAS